MIHTACRTIIFFFVNHICHNICMPLAIRHQVTLHSTLMRWPRRLTKSMSKRTASNELVIFPTLALLIPLHKHISENHELWRNELCRCPHPGVKSILVLKTSNVPTGAQPISAPNLLATPPRMLKQLQIDRDAYHQMFTKLVQFQEASCGIEAPTASWLHYTYELSVLSCSGCSGFES